MAFSRCLGFVLSAFLAVSATSWAQITVDGNLADLSFFAQSSLIDPPNDICTAGKSGFDVARVFVFYKATTDELFVGIDLMDVPPGLGLAGPGVPGDADGDNNADGPATNPSCNQRPFLDQDGVGIDEEYNFLIDTNVDGDFTDAVDRQIRYRGNSIAVLPGNSNRPITCSPVTIQLGTVGSPTNSIGIPDTHENRSTADIEMRIANFSCLDATPTCFRYTVFAGSFVDGLLEDQTNVATLDITRASCALTQDVLNVTAGGFFTDLAGARAGEIVRFRIQFANTGNALLPFVTVAELLPAGLNFLPGSVVGATASQSGQMVTFSNLGGSANLPVGVVRTLTFDATVAAGPQGCLRATATGHYVPPAGCGTPELPCADSADVCIATLLCTKLVSLDGTNYSQSVAAVPGQEVFFRVAVTNPSVVPFINVVVVDILPARFVNPFESDPQCGFAGQTLNCNLGALAPAATRTVDFRATIAAGPGGALSNTAQVTGRIGGTTFMSACTANVAVLVAAIDCVQDVSLDGITFSTSVSAVTGQVVTFRVRLTNTGQVVLNPASIVDTLPAAFANVQVVSPGSCFVSGSTINCPSLGPLQPNQSLTVIFRGTVVAATGSFTSVVTAMGITGTPANPGLPVNDSCQAGIQVLSPCISCEKEVSLDGTVFSSTVIAAQGQVITFRVRITNCGTATFGLLSLADTLPAGFANVQVLSPPGCTGAGNLVNCASIGPLGPGQTIAVVYRATVAAPFGTLVNTATVLGQTGSPGNPGTPVSDSCSAAVIVGIACLDCVIQASLDGVTFTSAVSAVPGQVITFRVRVVNCGQTVLSPVSLADTLPAGFTNVQSISPGTCSTAGNTVTCNLGSLLGGQSRDVLLRATLVATSGSLVNTATVSGQPPGGAVINDACSVTVNVQTPCIFCTKQVSLDGVSFLNQVDAVTGQVVTFRVNVTNCGQARLDQVNLVDTLPPGLVNVQVISPLSCADIGNTINCPNLGPLIPGQSRFVLFRATVTASGGTLTNTANVIGVAGTPANPGTPLNDSCSSTVRVRQSCVNCTKEVSSDGIHFFDRVTVGTGLPVTFRVRITNCGEAAFVASLTDPVPAGFADVQVLSPGGCSVSGNTVSCAYVGLLNAGQSLSIRYRATVVATAGVLQNTATVEALTGTPGNPGATLTDSCFASVVTQAFCAQYSAMLEGSQVVPPTPSTATGSGLFLIDTVSNRVSFNITVGGLTGIETGAHIHGPAARGSNAGPLFTLPLGSPKIGVWNYPPALEPDLLSGRLYLDVHTSSFPDGEIRGQIEEGCSRGNVNSGVGPIVDVLRVNGSVGAPGTRVVEVAVRDPIRTSLAAAPGGPDPGRYFLYVWFGCGSNPQRLFLAHRPIGCTVNPTPFSAPRTPQPYLCVMGSGLGLPVCAGVPEAAFPPASAPWSSQRLLGYLGPITVTLQAVVEDDNAGNTLGFSVTNAVTIVVR